MQSRMVRPGEEEGRMRTGRKKGVGVGELREGAEEEVAGGRGLCAPACEDTVSRGYLPSAGTGPGRLARGHRRY